MRKFIALGDGDNAVAFALGALARDLTDEEYEAADAAGLLSDEAKALFERVAEAPASATGKGKAAAPAEAATRPASGKDGD